MYTIKRVNVGSAFRVGAVSMALVWGIFGLLLVLWMVMIGEGIDSTIVIVNGTETDTFSDGATSAGIFMYLCGLPVYAIIGGFAGAIYALVYNLVARWVGGLELELEPMNPVSYDNTYQSPEKRKFDDYDPFQ